MFVASVSTLIFNANPLLRYDGYYILSDVLEIPNLRQKSTEYSLGLIKRHIFRLKLQQPLPPVGQRFWLLTYSIASSIYRVFIGIMIVVVVYDKVPIVGVLMAIGGVVTWAGVPDVPACEIPGARSGASSQAKAGDLLQHRGRGGRGAAGFPDSFSGSR